MRYLATSLLLISSYAYAQGLTPATPIGVVQAYRTSNSSSWNSGTITLIAKGEYAYWLTASHIFYDGSGNYLPVAYIKVPGKGTYSAKVVKISSSTDLALLRTSPKGTPDPLRIWTGNLASSMVCYSEGYASRVGFGRRQGKPQTNNRMARWSLPSLPGDSGGCIYTIYNNKRYLVGVTSGSNWPEYRNWSTDDGYTIGASPKTIRDFLQITGGTVEQTGCCIFGGRTLGGRRWRDPLQYQQNIPRGQVIEEQPEPG